MVIHKEHGKLEAYWKKYLVSCIKNLGMFLYGL